jgi:hypothetical protein
MATEWLCGKRAHDALSRALGDRWIIPDTGTRISDSVIEFSVIRRGMVYDPPSVYRTRISEDGVLLGSFVGEVTGEVPR